MKYVQGPSTINAHFSALLDRLSCIGVGYVWITKEVIGNPIDIDITSPS